MLLLLLLLLVAACVRSGLYSDISGNATWSNGSAWCVDVGLRSLLASFGRPCPRRAHVTI